MLQVSATRGLAPFEALVSNRAGKTHHTLLQSTWWNAGDVHDVCSLILPVCSDAIFGTTADTTDFRWSNRQHRRLHVLFRRKLVRRQLRRKFGRRWGGRSHLQLLGC